ncbi:hypothetical protein H5410_042564 [Solanum commersonii]|uniref:Uncharacterized protein n=1 Tax=Solanum commersonii TaxID=4109 RepID=A0A9J5XWD0_SOLCO|nr:hypothetical protein H5410_042564 [Solanum commersonii]
MHRQDVVEAQQRWPFLSQSQQCLQKRSPGDGRETKTPLELFLEGGYPYKSEMLHSASDKESLSNTGSTSEERMYIKRVEELGKERRQQESEEMVKVNTIMYMVVSLEGKE